jgi:hypothetical protein
MSKQQRSRPGVILSFRFAAALSALSSFCAFAQAATNAAAFHCRAIAGADTLLRPGSMVFLGELHGTREGPEFAGELACRAARQQRPVVLGLEMAAESADSVRAFVQSSGSAREREAFMANSFWHESYRDGRTSEAMFALVERVRALRALGAQISVVPFSRNSTSGKVRDTLMAAVLTAALRRSPNAVAIMLSGDVHARLALGTPFDSSYAPMAYLTARALHDRRAFAFNMARPGGSAWLCTASECGVHSFRAAPFSVGADTIRFFPVRERSGIDMGFDGQFGVRTLTASPPVIHR